ncbi:branched-chain amino acid ABC transporter ATP-binding protein [candidate division WOR-3 bacterium]|uniref:Branched-chain amino acid ABC transporter ATP-binding protein n=1 Tax=candidate division WOR-3 bacterium TaxID=2052148 RepID=A0A660SEA3_UNCW3|nr:MAG: branched-chain amino acid ABC transporter ATP-binding protein [candidate division WOR-3 bacterium]
MLRLDRVSAGYGKMVAIKEVSLEVGQGTITALIGPNGAGKSTTVGTIMGLVTLQSGSIQFEGEDITLLSPEEIVELGIALVPEGRRLFGDMTVLENLLVGATTERAKGRRDQTLAEVLELFPVLKERKDQLARTLSGGEQQMLAIGRGLMARPKLLLLDEPSLGLAPILVDQVLTTIERIREEGVSLLVVEQNVERILRIADYGYVLENGRIVQSGSDLLSRDSIRKAYLGIVG